MLLYRNTTLRINIYPIQGMLLGLEWDWDNKWLSLNFFIVKIIVNY